MATTPILPTIPNLPGFSNDPYGNSVYTAPSTVDSNNGNNGINTVDGSISGYGNPSIIPGPNGYNNPQAGYGPDYGMVPSAGNKTNTSLGGTLSGTTVNTKGTPGPTAPPTPGPTGNTQSTPNGTPTTPPPPDQNFSQVPQYQPTPEGTAYINQLSQYQQQIQNLYSQTDQNYNAQLAQINAEMGNQKSAQEQENIAYAAGVQKQGLATGLTPQIMSGEMNQAVSDGIQKITDLTVKQNGLILDAQKANITDKMSILKQLQDIDTQKYQTVVQMKQDFYTQQKAQMDLQAAVVGQDMPAIYQEIQNLPPEEQQAKLAAYSQQLGIPQSTLQGYYTAYDQQQSAPIRDLRAQLMSEAPDVGWSTSDLTLSPQEFAAKLGASKDFQAKMLSTSLDNALKSAQISDTNAEASLRQSQAALNGNSAQTPVFAQQVLGTPGNQWLNLTNIPTSLQKSALAWAAKVGIPALTGADAKSMKTIATAQSTVQQMTDLFKKVATKNGVALANIKIGAPLSKLFQTNNDLAAYQALYSQMVQVAGALAGTSAGTRSKALLDAFRESDFPKPGSSLGYGLAQIEQLATGLNADAKVINPNLGTYYPAGTTNTIGGVSYTSNGDGTWTGSDGSTADNNGNIIQ